MKQVSKLIRGIIGLMVAATILLVSDLSNREDQDVINKIVSGRKLKFCLAHYVDSPNSENCQNGILQGLKDMGLEEGTHFTLEIFNAQGDVSTLNSIAGTIGSSKWDLVFATSTPTIQTLSQKVKNAPVVFTNVGDPVKAGLGESFEKHNPGMTGVSTMSDFEGLVKMVKAIQPNTKRIGTVFTPAEVNSVAYKDRLEEAAVAHKLELVTVPANTATEVYDAAISLSLKNIDAFCQISDNLTASCSSSIIKVARNRKIPYYAFITKQIAQGAVAAAARDYFQAGYDAAVMGKRILEGEDPASIPYQYVTKTVYTFNKEVADVLNITFPEDVLKLSQSAPGINKSGEKLKLCMAHYVDSQPSEDCEKGIRQVLKDMGLTEKIDFTFEVFNAHGDISNLNSIAEAISSSKWDLVFSSSTPTIQALSKRITDSPIVFTNVADPVAAGIGKSFEVHNRNVTGISTKGDFPGLIDMVKKIHPNIKRVGTIFTPGETNSVSNKNNMDKAASAEGIQLIAVPVNTPTDVYDAAVSLSLKGIEAFCQIVDNLTATCSPSILKVAKNSKIPYYGLVSDQIKSGAVAVAARDYFQAGYDAGMLGKRILEGENPADIPFCLVTKTVFTVNEEAAAFFNVTIPESVRNKTKLK